MRIEKLRYMKPTEAEVQPVVSEYSNAAITSLISSFEELDGITECSPISLYSSNDSIRQKKSIHSKPLLLIVLIGECSINNGEHTICSAGSFLFLPRKTEFKIIEKTEEQRHMVIAIEFEDRDCTEKYGVSSSMLNHVQGAISDRFAMCLKQFLEWAARSPSADYSHRRKEVIDLLCAEGYQDIPGLMFERSLKHSVKNIISQNFSAENNVDILSSKLSMSKSTMRRRLAKEGISLQEIKDEARLEHALYLLDNTKLTIGQIALQCGYQSQSRFSELFRSRVGIVPSIYRKPMSHISTVQRLK
ncbi:MAG: helix-turn-helix transcriptional regulator [Pseudomonadales bacterium]